MLSNVELKYNSDYLHAVPLTEKSYSTQISVSKLYIAYCIGNVVIVRKQTNNCKDNHLIYTGHKFPTTAVEISPSGVFAASADESGCVKIWFLDDGWAKFTHQVLESKILGIHWNEKSDRILVYGFGGKRGFARYVSWDTSNTMGEVIGMTKNVICGDITKSKPYYYLAASEDLSLRVYSGNNPTKKYINTNHTKYICNAKFSPSGKKFAIGGLEKKLVIYETESGNLIKSYEKDDELSHKGGIIGIQWLTEDILATCSLDHTVKVWDLSKEINKTLYPINVNEIATSENHVQCGIAKANEFLISINLDGSLNLWSIKSFLETNDINSFSEYPERTIHGHQNSISHVLYNYSQKKLYSSDVSGRIIIWDHDKNTSSLKIFKNDLKSLKFDKSERYLYGLTVEGSLTVYDTDLNVITANYYEKENPIGLCIGANGQTIICFSNKLLLIDANIVLKENKFKHTAQCVELNTETNEIYIGDSEKGVIYFYDASTLEFIKEINFHHHFSVSNIKVSNSGKLVASADSNKSILIWDPLTNKIISDKLYFHTTRVYGICWNKDDSLLVSVSLDNQAIIWNMTDYSRINMFPVLDVKIALTCCFYGEERVIVVGGHNCSPKLIPIDQKVTN